MAEDLVTVLFYVNPESNAIDGVFAFFPMGMFLRENGDWTYVTREESRIDGELANDDVYQLNWDTDEVEVDDTMLDEDFDGDHVAVKTYDNGELDVSELEKYAKLIRDSKDIYEVPTQE